MNQKYEKSMCLSRICQNTCAAILCFLCLTHLFLLVGFFLNLSVAGYVVPMSLAVSLIFTYMLARRRGDVGKAVFYPVIIFMGLLSASIVISIFFYDMSWDGLWYHLTAVHKMEEGWNPVKQPMPEDVVHHAKLWVTHYAKGSWYNAVAMFKITGNIDSSKFNMWLAMFASFLSIFAGGLELGLKRNRAFILALLVSLNPVVTCQLYCSYVDGLTISYLACFVAMWICWMRKRRFSIALIGSMSAILAINAKFTGLVYLCFIMLAGGIYCLVNNRKAILQYAGIQIFALLLGVVVFGYNPYITNTVHRGHPFYPVCGSAEYPSLVQQGNDLIEKYETPDNMKGRNRFVRLGYALFGRPVYEATEPVRLTFPFVYSFEDMGRYYFHEQRISGFGPYFGGAFILSSMLSIIILTQKNSCRLGVILCIVILAASLLISKDTWWARYGPQMWWIPIVPLAVVFKKRQTGGILRFAQLITFILLINVLIVSVVHVNWEINSTKTLKQQIAQMKDGRTYEVNFKWFQGPFSRRLKKEGVSFVASDFQNQDDGVMELISVCPGYPGTVIYKPVKNSGKEDSN